MEPLEEPLDPLEKPPNPSEELETPAPSEEVSSDPITSGGDDGEVAHTPIFFLTCAAK